MKDAKLGYDFYGFTIPPHMLDGLNSYIMTGRPVGGFLTAVLNNDLMQAMDRADEHNRANIAAYTGYLYNEAPPQCFGSPEKVKAWMGVGGLEGAGLAQYYKVASA